MDSTRQNKISRLIQKDLADIFQKEGKMFSGVLISVTNVRISPDLSIARVYLSIFPSEKGSEILFEIKQHAVQNSWSAWPESGKATSNCSAT